MAGPEVTIVPTGTANIASVMAAFRRVGAEPKISSSPENIETSRFVVLPGVGDFGTSMQALKQSGCASHIVNRLTKGKPTLSICVGLQLLCSKSEESPDETGLGVIPLDVSRFPDTVRVPQIGWNRVVPKGNNRFITEGYAYFANSFRLTEIPAGWEGALTDHGGRFVSALEKGEVLACQFHPELSGKWGLEILARWLGLNTEKEGELVDL